MGWQKLDGSRRCQVHLGSTWQHAARANRFPIRVEEDGRVREPARSDTFPLRGLGTKKSAKQSQFGIDSNHWYRRKLNQDRPDRRGENKANSWPVARNSGEWRGKVASGREQWSVASESEGKDPLRSARASRPRCSANRGSAGDALTGGDFGRRGRAGQRPCPN